MRTTSCGTTRPAPRLRCPTSLFPIWPSGRPTARPDASSRVRGARSHRRCHTGVSPSSMALPSRPGRKPQPSSTISTTGVRAPRGVAILEAMQSSRVLRALPVVFALAASPLVAQAQYQVEVDGEWFHQEPGQRRLARLARGARVAAGGAVEGPWTRVTMEGWIFERSVGPANREGFDLMVTRSPEENLRAAPNGALVARLVTGVQLTRVAASGGWVRVRRDGWVRRAALAPLDRAAASAADTTRAAADSAGVDPGAVRTA